MISRHLHIVVWFTPLLLFISSHFSFGQGFTDVSVSSGITVSHDGDNVFDFKIGTGAAWLDYNKDGWMDLYVTMRTSENYLYKNNGNNTFTDVAATLGVQDATGDGGGVSIVDFNNDGWVDIFLSNCQENVLLKNNSGTSFTDITSTAFPNGSAGGLSRSPSASWGDYDNDGYLDLYIAQHTPPSYNQGQGTTEDIFFHNNGNETFTDVTNLLGTSNLTSWGFIGGWTDFDKDDDMDIILVNDCDGTVGGLNTKVFRNDGGNDPTNWNFTEVAVSVGINDCRNGMGIGMGDFNRDGWTDIFYTNIGDCVLFQNNSGTFSDVSTAAGINNQPSTHFSWGSTFIDYDMDMWQDIAVAIGTLDISQFDPQPNMFFKNNGNGTFTESALSLGLADIRRTRSMVYADYDNDGDLDLYMVNYGEPCRLMRNDNNSGNNWLKIKLEGSQSNVDGLGSKISVETPDGVTQHFETRSGSNLGGGDSPLAHFGLASNTSITEVKIEWLSGEVQTFNNVSINSTLFASEPLAPLPVELINFQAYSKNNQVKIEWATGSETNNKHFIIQRSNDASVFKDIGKIEGQGTTSISKEYAFWDQAPLDGPNYYRLKQIDFNGDFSYSFVRLVEFLDPNTFVKVFPNPSKNGKIQLNFSNQNRFAKIEIRDLLGKLIFEKQVDEIGEQLLEIPTTHWNNGIYLIRVSNLDMDKKIKVIIQN